MSPQTIRTPRSPRNSVEDPAGFPVATVGTQTSLTFVGGKAERRLVGRRDFLHNPVEKGINISTIRIVGFTSEISRFSSERSRLYTKMAAFEKKTCVFFCLMRWIGEMYIVMKYPEFHCNIFYTCLYVLVEWISGSHHETFMTSDWHTFKHLHWLATWPNHDPDKSTNPKSRPNLSTHNLDSIWIHRSIISRKFHDYIHIISTEFRLIRNYQDLQLLHSNANFQWASWVLTSPGWHWGMWNPPLRGE